MNNSRLDNRVLRSLINNLGRRADEFLAAAAQGIVTDIDLSFGTSPPGRAYQRGGVTHIASIEGYPPNVDTGTLAASIAWFKERHLRYIVHDGVEYGIWLEEGTENMAPRPFVAPVFEEWRRRELLQLARNFRIFDG
jgi:hypothetical protein